MEEINHD